MDEILDEYEASTRKSSIGGDSFKQDTKLPKPCINPLKSKPTAIKGLYKKYKSWDDKIYDFSPTKAKDKVFVDATIFNKDFRMLCKWLCYFSN